MFSQHQSEKLFELLEYEEIRQLRQRYSELLDGGRTSDLDKVFTKDAIVSVTVGEMKGLEQIKASLKDAYTSFDTLNRRHYPFMHAISNHQIQLIDDSNASGSCYLIDFVTDRQPEHHPVLLLGRYLDRYVKVDGQWRIAWSELDVTWPVQE